MSYPIDKIRDVYTTLIEKSWSNKDLFEIYQSAWNILADVWDVEGDIPSKLHFKRKPEVKINGKE